MTLEQLYGPVAVGNDTTGNFRLSFKGLAVRTTPEGRFIAREGHQFVDVTGLTIDGGDNLVYRLPVTKVQVGDVIVISDNPFSVLFVENVHDNHGQPEIEGFSPATNLCVEYCPPANILGCRIFVKVMSLMDKFLHRGKDICELLPVLMMANNQGGSSGPGGGFPTVLLMNALAGKDGKEFGGKQLILFWLALSQSTQGDDASLFQTLLMFDALKGGTGFFGCHDEEGEEAEETDAKKDKTKSK